MTKLLIIYNNYCQIMSIFLNENETTFHGSTNTEPNSNQNYNQDKKAQEGKKNEGLQNYVNSELNSQNNLLSFDLMVNQNNGRDNTSKKFLRKKRKFFRVNKGIKKKHDSYAIDNNITIIIKHFVTFFLDFMSLAVNKGISLKTNLKVTNNREIQFVMNYKIKRNIYIEDIKTKTVEDLLKIKENSKTYKKNKKKIVEIQKNNEQLKLKKDIIIQKESNEEKLNEIKKEENLGSSFDKLFRTPIIDIFKEIYIKNKKELDLEIYGIKNIKLDLNNNQKKYQAYEKLKEKYIKDKKKLEIFDNLIDNKFIPSTQKSKQKSIIFKTEKNELLK